MGVPECKEGTDSEVVEGCELERRLGGEAGNQGRSLFREAEDWRLEDPSEDVTGWGHLRQEEQSDMDGETGRESEEVMAGMG